MRHSSLAALALSCAVPVLAAPGLPLERAVPLVRAASAYETVERLASPPFAGRLSGTDGERAADEWVAAELERAGLSPLRDGSYLQSFPVTVSGVDAAEMAVVAPDGALRRLVLGPEFTPLLYSGSGDVTAEVVFVGYGISAPRLGRDDYAGIDVCGKIVMAVRGAPRDGRDWLAYNSHRARTANARAHGAAGYLFAEEPAANPNGEPIADLPMAAISADVANELLSPSKLKLDSLESALEKGAVTSFATGRKVRLAVAAREPRRAEGHNVVALLPGRDPALAPEYVIVGAHLDHCGDWPELLPGADDNASGSATVLEIARAMARLGPRPARTVVFAFFGGEEMGLLGSRHMAAHPPAGLKRCVGVLNLDMTGVGTGAYVSGGVNFPEIQAALRVGRDRWAPGMALKAGRSQGEPRADHGPFQAAGIPAVSLFGMGEHHGYHTAEDTLWWITPRSMEAIGRAVMDAAVALADGQSAAAAAVAVADGSAR